MTTGDGRTITYTAFDKPTRITKGATTVDFFYGPDRKRFKCIDNTVADGTVTAVYAAGKAYEWIRDASGTKMKHYIGDFAAITKTAEGSGDTVNYLHRDHLSSVDTITDHTGAVIQRMSFDAWGKRREINWQAMAEGAITAFNTDTTTRGFTGHEMIDSVGLIHMNGRVYDPTLGRFLSADPNVQALDNLQNFNRYSYVLNNPLSYTDPTGFFFSKLFKAIGRAFGKLFQAIGRALKKLLRSPIVRAIIQIVACANPVTCVAASGAMAAAAGGSIGDVFKAMAMSFISSQVWGAVGNAIKGFSRIGQMLVHGVVNGALTVAQGGNFLVGFATGAIGKLGGIIGQSIFGPYGSGNGILGRAFVSAIAGCAGAVVSGGKCANGAISAAFASMYNGDSLWDSFKDYLDTSWILLKKGPSDLAKLGEDFWEHPLDTLASLEHNLAGLQLATGAARVTAGAARALGRLCSFHGSTQVKTDKGFVAIKDIRITEHKVWARDEHTGEMKFQKVLDTYSNPYRQAFYVKIRDLKSGEEQTLISNYKHPFYVAKQIPVLKLVANGGQALIGTNDTGEWIRANKLEAGHRLLNANETWSEVVSVRVENYKLKAYNLHVDKFHTYYVRGAANDNAKSVWVHNAKLCGELSEVFDVVTIAKVDVGGSARMVNGTYKVNIFSVFTKEPGSGHLANVAKSLYNTAKSKGAGAIDITGQLPRAGVYRLLRPHVNSMGLSIQRSGNTIRITGPVQ